MARDHWDVSYDDPPAITDFAATTQTARIKHTCTMCKTPIEPGERYRRIPYKDYDQTPPKFHMMKMHLRCDDEGSEWEVPDDSDVPV